MITRKMVLRIVALLCALLILGGCIGTFNATARVKTWNQEIENRWLGEGVYLLLRIPQGGVYGLVGLSDLLIFNSIVFWGGTNPIDPPSAERRQAILEMDAERHGPGKMDDDEKGEEDSEG